MFTRVKEVHPGDDVVILLRMSGKEIRAVTVVHRPGHHDSRPDEKANEDEGPYIGAHYTNNPGCKGAANEGVRRNLKRRPSNRKYGGSESDVSDERLIRGTTLSLRRRTPVS